MKRWRILRGPLVTALLLPLGARAAAFEDLVQRVPAPPAESSGAFSSVTRWHGRLFVLHDAACFASADGGRTWARQAFVRPGPKGPAPALEGGWFTRADNGLWLGNREGALAWRFDPDSGSWRPWAPGAGAIAAAGSGDRLYALSADHVLRVSRDAGANWTRLLLPDTVRVGTFFDDLLADGDALLLRARDAGNAQPAAYSLDGGATWEWLPAHAIVALARGCAYAFSATMWETRCARERAADPLPFARPRFVFGDGEGALFAWSEAGVHSLGPAPGAGWTLVAAPAAVAGWSAGRDFLFCLRDGTLAWFTGRADAVSVHKPIRKKYPGKRFRLPGAGRDLLGRGPRRPDQIP
jgi:hypothetical protein